MIAAALALLVTLHGAVTRVTYADVPASVTRVSLYVWIEGSVPTRAGVEVERAKSDLSLRGEAGRRVVLRLERADGTYLTDGPFWWPADDGPRVIDHRWRRTVTMTSADVLSRVVDFEWITAAGEGRGAWPQCFPAADRLWSCWGVPYGESGVIVGRVGERIWSASVGGGEAPALRSSRWGRLIAVRNSVTDEGVRIRFGRPVAGTSQRIAGVRVETAAVAGAKAVMLPGGVAWVGGEDVPRDAWLEITSTNAGPAYFDLQEVADGDPAIPLVVTLDDSRVVDGVVTGARNEPASGALVTVFRRIDARRGPAEPSRDLTRRVFAAETTADGEGVFHLDRLGDADYEIVAWHPQLGRAALRLGRPSGSLNIKLAAAGVVHGRVLVDGRPAAGVDVISVPAPDAFRSAQDPMDLKGGDTRSGPDGRFSVMPAAAGGGELRVGGGRVPVRRIPLPRAVTPLLDLGDIELGLRLEITVVLDEDPGCDLRAVGPVGQSGLQIVTGVRSGTGIYQMAVPEPGLWVFQLLCGKEERPLVPSSVRISARDSGKEVRFSVR